MKKYIKILIIFIFIAGIGIVLKAYSNSNEIPDFPDGDKYIVLLTFDSSKLDLTEKLELISSGEHYMEKTDAYCLYGIRLNDKQKAVEIYQYINNIKSLKDRLYMEVYQSISGEEAKEELRNKNWSSLCGNYYYMGSRCQEYLKYTENGWELTSGYPYILSGY